MMKTNAIPAFPGSPHLQNILQQLTNEFPLEALFYREAIPSQQAAQLLICTATPKDAVTIRERKWVRNAYAQTQMLINVQNWTQLEYEAKSGNPFLLCFCNSSQLVYGTLKEELQAVQKNWKKNFRSYKDRFYHEQDLLVSQARQCHGNESVMGSFLGYLSVYEHDLHYLESLYLGSISSDKNLHERIHSLIPYLPFLEQVFVKKNEKTFYLIDALEKAKIVDDEYLLNNELYPCICEREEKLYSVVKERFRELKRIVEQQKEIRFFPEEQDENPLEKILSEAMAVVIKRAKPEEIYHYHTKIREQQTVYYLLLVGESLGIGLLESIRQSVSDKTENKCDLVLLGHSRAWIQENVYLWQGFFKKIMTGGQIIYASQAFHPAIHWEEPYTPHYPDLSLYYSAAKRSADVFMRLNTNLTEDNYEGFYQLFATAFTRMLRIYIYRSLVYMPNYLAPEILWKLCTYANPDLEKLEYLFDKVSKERFFLLLNHYLKFNDHITYGSEEQLQVMEEILVQLMTETEAIMGLDCKKT